MANRFDHAWQKTLLPLMSVTLICAALFFAWLSVSEFADFKARLSSPGMVLSPIFDQFDKSSEGAGAARFNYLQWRSIALLEEETLRHRYAQGNTTVLARMWTRLMGFTTGMVLAIVGAAFILGKLEEGQSELKQETELLKVSLATSSPGIVLAVLGSILMSITLLTRFDVEIRDAPVYLNSRSPQLSSSLPDPAKLLTSRKADDDERITGRAKERDPAQGGSP